MLKKSAMLAAVISVGATWAQAQDTTGNELHKYCNEPGAGSQSFCYGYILGAVEGLLIGGALEATVANPGTADLSQAPLSAVGYCVPSGVTKRQVRDLVVAYLNDRPAERHDLATLLVHGAMMEAFPC